MFVPGDPRFDEMLKLADKATSEGLRDQDRPRWRELVSILLGELRDKGHIPERRQHLRAAMEIEVDILSPDEMASLATSTIGAGGLALRIKELIPVGTMLELSIKVEQRKVPIFARAQVVYSRDGEVGAMFVDLYQNDRELIEAVAARALLARVAIE
jgi:type IV pilus assembly protein PilZ